MNKTTDIKINEIISVYDGDTFRGRVNSWPNWLGDNVPFRIAGIDTPEIRGKSERVKKLGREAREYAKQRLTEAKAVKFDIAGKDKYGRILAHVYVDGFDLAESMIFHGYAVPYDGGSKQVW